LQARPYLAALLLTCAPNIAVIAQQADSSASPAITTTMVTARLNEWEQSYARLKRDIWNLQRVTSMFGRDFRGRTLSDDLRDFSLTPATEKRFTEQRALVVAQLDKGELQLATTTLIALYRELREELERIEQIGAHRMRQRQVARQRDLWQQLATTVPAYKAPDTLRRLEQQAVEDLNVGRFDQTTRTTYAALLRAYAAERTLLLKSAGGVNTQAIDYERRTPCDVPAKTTSGNATPSVANSTTPDYPATSKRSDQEGNVMLRVRVSTTGCATSFAITTSSGWPALDDSALDWIETVNFLPAERNGKAFEMYVYFPVHFKLEK
jgi:TonB family protein